MAWRSNLKPGQRGCDTSGISHFSSIEGYKFYSLWIKEICWTVTFPAIRDASAWCSIIFSKPPERLLCRRKKSLSRAARVEWNRRCYVQRQETGLDFRNRVIHQAFHNAGCHPKGQEKTFSSWLLSHCEPFKSRGISDITISVCCRELHTRGGPGASIFLVH